MKKLIIILSIAALAFSNKSQAQAMFYTSYGTQHLWGMPPEVQWALESNYYNFHMVHTRRFYDRGRLFFDVVLQRNGVFVDIRIDGRGYIFNSAYRNYYPFHNHVCSGYCGFHRDYYMSYRVAYGHPHYYKHNHVYYRPNVVYVKHDHHHYGNNHGHHNNNNNHVNQGRSYRIDRSDNGRVERINQTPARGARPNIDRSNNGVRDHGAGVGRGNGNGNGNGNVGNQGPRGNNGVRDHGVGEGRGNGQGKGQGFGNGNGNSGRVYQASNARTSSPARVSAPTSRTSSPARIASSSSSSRISGSSTSGRSSRSSNSSGSSRSSSGRTVRTR